MHDSYILLITLSIYYYTYIIKSYTHSYQLFSPFVLNFAIFPLSWTLRWNSSLEGLQSSTWTEEQVSLWFYYCPVYTHFSDVCSPLTLLLGAPFIWVPKAWHRLLLLCAPALGFMQLAPSYPLNTKHPHGALLGLLFSAVSFGESCVA